MPITVFISATSYDMEADCRPAAYDAIATYGGGVAITMENWVTESLPAPEVCHTMLKENSSHYVGIYGYRYGWIPGIDQVVIPAAAAIPAATQKSITELEYDWAKLYGKPLAIFLPARGSAIDLDLKKRADLPTKQEEAAAAAQISFQRRVKGETTVMMFPHVGRLALLINQVVQKWNDGGFRAMGNATRQLPAVAAQDESILKLGRRQQVRRFEDWLDEMMQSGCPRAAAFVIHAAGAEFGSGEMVRRLEDEFEESSHSDIKTISFHVDAIWQEKSLPGLLNVIAQQIAEGWEPANVAELAARLGSVLQTSAVLLKMLDAQRFSGGLPALLETFWKPLLATLPQNLPHQLLLLLEHESCVDTGQHALLLGDSDLEDFDDCYQPGALVVLPELRDFSEKEIRIWLASHRHKSDDEAAILAATLFKETAGKPQTVYLKLLEL